MYFNHTYVQKCLANTNISGHQQQITILWTPIHGGSSENEETNKEADKPEEEPVIKWIYKTKTGSPQLKRLPIIAGNKNGIKPIMRTNEEEPKMKQCHG